MMMMMMMMVMTTTTTMMMMMMMMTIYIHLVPLSVLRVDYKYLGTGINYSSTLCRVL
jgi:hypothetical protein